MIKVAITRAHKVARAAGDVEKSIILSEEQYEEVLEAAQEILDLFADDHAVGIVTIVAWPKEKEED